VRFDNTDLTERMDQEQQAKFEEIRDWIGLGWRLRWLIFLPALLFLALVAFIGGHGWRGRAMWAGGALAMVTLVFFIAVSVGWAATASMREFSVAGEGFQPETQAEFPALVALAESGEIENLLEKAASSWVSGLAYSTVPWAIAAVLLFAIAALFPKYWPSLSPILRRPGGGGSRSGVRARDAWVTGAPITSSAAARSEPRNAAAHATLEDATDAAPESGDAQGQTEEAA
jgi:hypothetical protein